MLLPVRFGNDRAPVRRPWNKESLPTPVLNAEVSQRAFVTVGHLAGVRQQPRAGRDP